MIRYLKRQFKALAKPEAETGKEHDPPRQQNLQTRDDVQILIDNIPALILYTDAAATLLQVNRKAADHLGLRPNEMLGKPLSAFFPQLGEDAQPNDANLPPDASSSPRFVAQISNSAGSETKWLEVTRTPIVDAAGGISGILIVAFDITERKSAEERLDHLAYHDHLTNLPNRRLFTDRLTQALWRAKRTGKHAAILFLDLDRFKEINDTMGHQVGDQVLKAVARRLSANLRAQDTIARLGGDEFVIAVEDLTHAEDAALLAQDILDGFCKPLAAGDQEVMIGTSIGISIYPRDGDEATDLVRHADTALYQAKKLGRNTYQFYKAELTAIAASRFALEKRLRHALREGEFILYYQPKVSLWSGKIVAAEALLRWQHPKLGILQPVEFIPLAEETGLIIPIGEWALRTACHQARTWLEFGLPAVQITVNFSVRQLLQRNLAEKVQQALQETGLPPQYLEMEIAEEILMQNPDRTIVALDKLKALGLTITLDNFGTGFSSLRDLKRFPLDQLKIDRALLRDILNNPTEATITSTLIEIAHKLGLKAIAKGVETESQLIFVRARHCDQMQGFFFSQPLPLAEMTALLEKDQRLEFTPNPETARASVLLVMENHDA